MKRISLLVLAALLYCGAAISQNQQWTEAFARADGATMVKGVEVLSLQGECNGNDVIFIKMINHNDYEVKFDWNNAMLVNESWMDNPNQNVKSSIVIEPKGEVAGSCAGTFTQLVVKVSDFGITLNEMKYFQVTGHDINEVVN